MFINKWHVQHSTVAIKLNHSYLAIFQVNTGKLPFRLGYDLLRLLQEVHPNELKENCQAMTFQAANTVHSLDQIRDIFKAIVRYPRAVPFEKSNKKVSKLLNFKGFFYIVDLDSDRFDTIFAYYDTLCTEMIEKLKVRNIYVEPVTETCPGPNDEPRSLVQFYGRFSSVKLFAYPPKNHYLREYETLLECYDTDLHRVLEPYRLIDEEQDAFTNLMVNIALEERLVA